MNPIGTLFQIMRSGSPQQFIQNMAGNSQMMNNPMVKNAIGMAQNGDMNGIEQMARNMCKERGIDPEQAVNQIKNQFGM